MLIIRLQRTGKKNAADFRIVLAQKTASAAKKFVEVLGSYNPRTKAFAVKNEERLKYWIAQHVEISPTAHNLLVSKNLLDAKKVKAFNTPKKPAEPVAPASAPQAASETPAEAVAAQVVVEEKIREKTPEQATAEVKEAEESEKSEKSEKSESATIPPAETPAAEPSPKAEAASESPKQE